MEDVCVIDEILAICQVPWLVWEVFLIDRCKIGSEMSLQ